MACSIEPHAASKWSSGESGHWKICEACGKTFDQAEHGRGSWTVIKEPEANAAGQRERVSSTWWFVMSEEISTQGEESSKETFPPTGDRGWIPFAAAGAAPLRSWLFRFRVG